MGSKVPFLAVGGFLREFSVRAKFLASGTKSMNDLVGKKMNAVMRKANKSPFSMRKKGGELVHPSPKTSFMNQPRERPSQCFGMGEKLTRLDWIIVSVIIFKHIH